MKIPIDSVKVGVRIRTSLRNVDKLMRGLSTGRLLHPIVVSQDCTLIAGQRRLEAAKRLGWTHIDATVLETELDPIEALRAELEENDNREDLDPTDAIKAGMELEKMERAAAAKRKLAGVKVEPSGNLPEGSKGRARDK